MTQEDKELLLKDLCARLPYGVKVKTKGDDESYTLLAIHPYKDIAVIGLQFDSVFAVSEIKIDCVLPHLRLMSSMTEYEEYSFRKWQANFENNTYDWLNAHHFDYRGLIEKGLAIALTEENNPYKE